ncbi:MAG: DUF2865 domain-containing protein, partial [Methyloligellaceae bacterium]
PGSSIDHMRSLAGQKYRHLANAYLYRKKFVASCRCKPEPWTVAERSRHHFYATGKPLPEQGQVKLAGKSSNISGDRLQDQNARLAENMIRDRQAARTVRSNYLIIRFDEMQEVSNGAQQLSEQIIRSKYYRGPAQHSSISNKPAAIRSLNTDSKIRIETPFFGDSR